MSPTISPQRRRFLSLAIAFVAVWLLMSVATWWSEPAVVAVSLGDRHELTGAQEETIAMVKELNGYLISMTTLMFGGLGWYLTRRQRSSGTALQAAFFGAGALLAVSFWYAAMTYAELTAELGQNLIGLVAKHSRILYDLQMEVTASGIAALLILIIFADTVTRQKTEAR